MSFLFLFLQENHLSIHILSPPCYLHLFWFVLSVYLFYLSLPTLPRFALLQDNQATRSVPHHTNSSSSTTNQMTLCCSLCIHFLYLMLSSPCRTLFLCLYLSSVSSLEVPLPFCQLLLSLRSSILHSVLPLVSLHLPALARHLLSFLRCR